MTASLIAFTASFALTALFGPIVIPFLHKLKFGQSILEIGPAWHKKKQGTPTMGGIMFILPIAVVTVCGFLFSADKADTRVWSVLFVSLAFGAIGFIDDYIKVVKKRNLGLTAKQKFFLQVLAAVAFIASLQLGGFVNTRLFIPFFDLTFDISYFYYPLAVFTIVGFVNGANLIDGVDGLAASVAAPIFVFFVYAATLLRGGSSAVFAAAACGAMIGFLLFNFHPAKVFMGDTGSLFIGGAITGLAFALDIPLIIFVAGLIYLLEALSVMLQVAYFKITHGKRLFKMSPIHHHFEMCGWSEVKITLTFSAFAAVCCLIAVAGVAGYYNI